MNRRQKRKPYTTRLPMNWRRDLRISCLAVFIGLAANVLAFADFNNVRVQLLNGSSIRCSIDSIDEEGHVIGRNVPEGLMFDQVVSLKTTREETPPPSGYQLIKILGGGSLLAKSIGVKDEQLTFQSNTGLSQLSLETVSGVVWNETDQVREMMRNPSPDNDRVIVQTENGERVVNGLLEGIDGTHVSLNFKGKSRRISLAIVNGVVSADLSLRPPKGAMADIRLSDGSSIRGAIVKFENEILSMELPGRNRIELSSSSISSMKIKSDKLAYLSDLDPVKVQEKALFAVQRSWQRDRSIKGGPLTLGFSGASQGTAKFDKGIGMQSYSQLVFANENEFDRFRAVVGIDTETNGRGDCVLSLVGDGVRLWSQRIRASDDPVSVSVDISGMSEIGLIVEPGEQFDLGDHVNWGMARFTKSN